jgi:hypothetical protein
MLYSPPSSTPVHHTSKYAAHSKAGVCKDEKAARDECFLFSEKGGETECLDKIDAYKKCMAGFGFKI